VLSSRRARLLLAAALVVLGGSTMLGWLIHVPALFELVHGWIPMVFNTGLCFLLCGTALLLERAPRLRTLAAAAVMALAGITLVELALDRPLGIDLAGLHLWYDYGNTRPGRMAPNTALGFLLAAAAILCGYRVRSRSAALFTLVLTFLVLLIGMTGLVGYLIAPDLLFGWARSARMALQTASGMVVAALCLFSAWQQAPWYSDQRFIREEAKISFLSGAVVALLTATAGLSGFVTIQKALTHSLEGRFTSVATARGPWLRAFANAQFEIARTLIDAAPLASPPDGSGAPLDAVAQRFIAAGFRGAAIQEGMGGRIATAGRLQKSPAFEAPLDANGTIALVWDDGLLLRTRHQVPWASGRGAHFIELDHFVPQLGTLLFNTAGHGASSEVVACVLKGTALLCLPDAIHAEPFTVPARAGSAPPLPMELALRGQTGVAHFIDYRGHDVLAAYSTLADGLGVVVKQDTVRAYAPIREALAWVGPVIAALALLGALALHSQIHPLVQRMRASEAAAEQALTRIRTVMEAAGEGIVTIDGDGFIRAANDAAHRMFGHAPGTLLGTQVEQLMALDARAAHRQGMARLSAGAAPGLAGRRDIEVQGLRQDGSEFPMEMTINRVPGVEGLLFVGVMRDITSRKETQERLARMAQYDNLTALPNRLLFFDRLQTAMQRATRSGHPLALMFLDLDGFKAINDQYGHASGDQLLQQVAHRLLAAVRRSDTVARLAGDEFTVLLEELKGGAADARAVGRKIVEAMRAPFEVAGQPLSVTVSVGLAIHDARSNPAETVEALLHRADQAMYAAKREGKNALRLADELRFGAQEGR
jgi:diguanylate cyclase (GGDEF)-like protein/PAS domain S-box-containing protein